MHKLREARHESPDKWVYAAFLAILIIFGGFWYWNHGDTSSLQVMNSPATGLAASEPAKEPAVPVTCTPSNRVPWGIAKVGDGSGGNGINVAILDTGVASHEDLRVSVCTDATGGRISSGCSDNNGRGTYLSGIVAANGGITGVAPNANIWAIKVCGADGVCPTDAVSNGIYYAVTQGANIILLPTDGYDSYNLRAAISYGTERNVLFVAPAGDNSNIEWPSADSKVIAVGALDSSDAVPSWSGRGTNAVAWTRSEGDVEFAAPGVNVESTWNDGCYKTLSTTNAAAAHVAGLAAKLWQGSAAATRTYLQYVARYNYKDIGGSGYDSAAGFGLPTAPKE